MKSSTTLVIGASENPERYANKAIKMLREYKHDVLAYGLRKGKVEDVEISTELPAVKPDTVTVYLGPKNQAELLEQLTILKPRRVIFNPGTENDSLESDLNKIGIETTRACTLVLLRTGQYND